jgi:hypothetical protein
MEEVAMRDRTSWRRRIDQELDSSRYGSPLHMLPEVELALFLMERVVPGRPAIDGWTLLGGYPFAAAAGHVGDEEVLARGRVYLGRLRRRYVWEQELGRYQQLPEVVRGYDVEDLSLPPVRRAVTRAADRWDDYATALNEPPAFERRQLPLAKAGDHWFLGQERYRFPVDIPDGLVSARPRGHDLYAPPAGGGEPVTAAWAELIETAKWMDRTLTKAGRAEDARWERTLGRVTVHYLNPDDTAGGLRVEGLLHLAGMVGAGKSTLRDVLAVWMARRGRRCTLLVGDVAEVLRLAIFFRDLGLRAAPIIGASTRDRHIERMHRRLATGKTTNLLAHDDAAFDFLSSACAIDGLRGLEARAPLRFREAPCAGLYPAHGADGSADSAEPGEPGGRERRPRRHGCPIWAACPRQHGYREQIDAEIWVATPASLVHSAVPEHQNAERIRYLELACRRSDLIIVDEADRVQMQLDAMFAPAATLVGRSPDSWLDNVQRDKIEDLARKGRLQLSEQTTGTWVTAMDTVTAAANRLYVLLVSHPGIRRWVSDDYFSAWTLHQQLLADWYPFPAGDEDADPNADRRKEVNDILDLFRDDPLGDGTQPDPEADALVRLCHETLSAVRGPQLAARLRAAMLRLSGLAETDERAGEFTLRFEFTLLLAALHVRLDLATALWPAVEAALSLDPSSNVLSRRPPPDYLPLVPESPMGNVLGFQFLADDGQQNPEESAVFDGRTGDLRFFRCAGVGRELLLRMHELTQADGRPGPNVILMSGTSWAGTSSRYHVHVPVHAVLLPPPEEIDAIARSEFRKEFLPGPDGRMLHLSGARSLRPVSLEQMLAHLAIAAISGDQSPLARELDEIKDQGRQRILLLTGSYEEAKAAARFLDDISEWTGRVCRLVSDDTDLDHTWELAGAAATGKGRALRRGDIASFAGTGAQLLVAPLLAVERGHNILNSAGKAAIGSVYFLARPHPRPDDITLAVQSINDWAVRMVRDGTFTQLVRARGSIDGAAAHFRTLGRGRWRHLLTRRLAWTSLPRDEQVSLTWDQLVVMWQVIGRLVRGGVAARVVFVDAAFAPREADLTGTDTPSTSLLHSMQDVLRPYFDPHSGVPAADRELATTLYKPLYEALGKMP